MGLCVFQPSEFAKLAVIIILAKYLKIIPGNTSTQLMDVVRPLILAIIPTILVLVQPDLGTACVITLAAASMVLFAGIGRRLLLWTGIGLVILLPVALLLGDHVLMGYQKRRLFSFLNPSYDPLGSGYHLLQSQIAIGSGGLLGKGFLQGTQKSAYVPSGQTYRFYFFHSGGGMGIRRLFRCVDPLSRAFLKRYDDCRKST